MCPACLSSLAITLVASTGALAAVTAVVKRATRPSSANDAPTEREPTEKGNER